MTTAQQDNAIFKAIVEEYGDEMNEAIRNILNCDYGFLIDVISKHFNPEDIFSWDQLENWAIENDFEQQ